jgi:hypothetical protein
MMLAGNISDCTWNVKKNLATFLPAIASFYRAAFDGTRHFPERSGTKKIHHSIAYKDTEAKHARK